MNFELTSERQMLQDTLRRYLGDRYTTEVRNRIIESDAGMSAEIWRELADLGIVAALFTEDQGGFGGLGFDIVTVFEELGRAGVVEPFLDTAVLAGGLVADLGSEAQRAVLERVVGGEAQLAWAHGEPTSRYDLSHVETTARSLDGGIELNGRKSVVVNAEAAEALVVTARESGEPDDPEGLSLFLVPGGTPGLSLRGYPLMGGARAAEVTLETVHVPEAARLGPAGDVYSAIERRVAMANVALSAEALGAMETAKALTVAYLGTRKQFGRPIGTFQALQHRMADLMIELEQARSAVILAAGHMADERCSRERHVSAAKNLIGRVGRLVAEESIQMHGGIAMSQEYELAHIAKRIVMLDHRLGDTDHHMERFIAFSHV
ncbi:acyl-CoA dehydrogenase family protein [Algihabitans albus]|uniref:acyl-CoA dehydrogenase family protein n=1 Tax=Algihabitans albus TaxID=2164067 RepID=UPI000E5D95F7|nr:acyl-CoA dehydrogenase family protein [Algihabitans albus]